MLSKSQAVTAQFLDLATADLLKLSPAKRSSWRMATESHVAAESDGRGSLTGMETVRWWPGGAAGIAMVCFSLLGASLVGKGLLLR
jgi:hypothetical protein